MKHVVMQERRRRGKSGIESREDGEGMEGRGRMGSRGEEMEEDGWGRWIRRWGRNNIEKGR